MTRRRKKVTRCIYKDSNAGWEVLLEDSQRRLKCQQCGRWADRLMLGHEQAAVQVP